MAIVCDLAPKTTEDVGVPPIIPYLHANAFWNGLCEHPPIDSPASVIHFLTKKEVHLVSNHHSSIQNKGRPRNNLWHFEPFERECHCSNSCSAHKSYDTLACVICVLVYITYVTTNIL